MIGTFLFGKGTEPGLWVPSHPFEPFAPLARNPFHRLNDVRTVTRLFPMEETFAVVPAAGSGVRMGLAHPKQFHPLHGKPILAWTLERLCTLPFIDGIMVVVPAKSVGVVRGMFSQNASKPLVQVIAGGARRQDSVLAGLHALPPTCRWVIIHDGVRPMATSELFRRTYEAARRYGAAVCACRAVETVKMAEDGWVQSTVPRDRVWLVQTPQVFRRDLLEEAFRQATLHGWDATDDASLVERLGVRVAIVDGEKSNIKITTPDDLLWASWFLEQSEKAATFGNDVKENPWV